MSHILAKDYPWIVNSDIPWKSLSKDIADAKVVLITTAGLYQWKTQKHFNLAAENGDSSFRELKRPIEGTESRYSHKSQEWLRPAMLDMNCTFPIDRLMDLTRERRIGSVSESHFSVMGEITNPSELIDDSIPKLIKLVQKYLIDIAIICPVGPLDHQTGGLIARALEDEGICTVMIGSIKSICENIKPPRTVLVRFPFGQLFGAPFDISTQKEVLAECLIHIKSIREPGEIAPLNLNWRTSIARSLEAKPNLFQLLNQNPERIKEPADKKKISADKF